MTTADKVTNRFLGSCFMRTAGVPPVQDSERAGRLRSSRAMTPTHEVEA